ncbi:uncharacterized protein LOC118414790 [Branchiostoma floridae]|uniref:Uncharacterized protein LOC118414790 n=1 Tax=Branchiostoma floridae TaxID=7739 RepID=A0A9J7MPR6_BRAFL|nr:uncharacterized protein LOC118414790 [Branchiostoma floridae]
MSKNTGQHDTTTGAERKEPRVFVIHAGEDKDSFVRPLVSKLQERGLDEEEIFFDDVSIQPGDVIRERIISTLSSESLKLAVVVVSTAFLSKPYWPRLEYETCLKNNKHIFPIWFDANEDNFTVFSESVGRYSPTLKQMSGRRVQRDDVPNALPTVASEIIQRLSTLRYGQPAAIQTHLHFVPSPSEGDSSDLEEDTSIGSGAGIINEQSTEDSLKAKHAQLQLIEKVGEIQLQMLKRAEGLLSKETITQMTKDTLGDLYQQSLRIIGVKTGSVIIHVIPRDLSTLDRFWRDYKSGQLSKHFTDRLVTDEMRAAAGMDLAVRVVMLDQQYRQWREYFNTRDMAQMTQKLPGLAMKPTTLTGREQPSASPTISTSPKSNCSPGMALQPNPVYQPEQIFHKTLEAASRGRKTKLSESSEDDTNEVNDALMRTAIMGHERHPYRYGIASVNFKGVTRGTGNATLRKLLYGQLQGQTRVSVLFAQECPWANPVSQLQLEDTFCYTGVVNEAGIIWDSELFELKRLDSYRLIGDKYPHLIQHRGRICISEMSIKDEQAGHAASSNIAVEKEPNVKEFIAISWHGPHKCTDKEKQLIFRDLLAFFKALTSKGGQKAGVIGGDFNFSIDKACDNIDDNYPGLAIPTSYGCETIDYFIFTSDLINILHAQQLSLDYDVGSVYTAQDRDRASTESCKTPSNQVIDHSPVFGVLDLGSLNPFSSPSKIKDSPRKIAEPSRMESSLDYSTDSSTGPEVRSSPKKRKEEGQATSTICGLSRMVASAVVVHNRLIEEELRVELRRRDLPGSSDRRDMTDRLCEEIERNNTGQGTEVESNLSREVSLAVLPRLNEEELRRELRRRDITPSPEDSQDKLMKRLCDEMGKEYFGQQVSSSSLENGTMNRNIQKATTREEANEVASSRTSDVEPMQEATTSLGGNVIGNAGAEKIRDDGQMQGAAGTSNDVEFVGVVAGSSKTFQSPNLRSNTSRSAADLSINPSLKRKVQDTSSSTSFNVGPSTSIKRSNTEEKTTRKDIGTNRTELVNPSATEGTIVKQEPSLYNFENMSSSEMAPGTGAGPWSGVIIDPGNDAERSSTKNKRACTVEGCGYMARCKSDLDQHNRKHTGDKPFKCDKCDFSTAYRASLKVHKTSQHVANLRGSEAQGRL